MTLNILSRVLAWASSGEASQVPSTPGAHRAQESPISSLHFCLSVPSLHPFWGQVEWSSGESGPGTVGLSLPTCLDSGTKEVGAGGLPSYRKEGLSRVTPPRAQGWGRVRGLLRISFILIRPQTSLRAQRQLLPQRNGHMHFPRALRNCGPLEAHPGWEALAPGDKAHKYRSLWCRWRTVFLEQEACLPR